MKQYQSKFALALGLGSMLLSGLPSLYAQEYDQRRIIPPATELVEYPIDSKFNAQLYQLENSGYDNVVFVAPKLYAYGSAEKARFSTRYLSRNKVRVSFPVVLTNGLEPTILAPDGISQINLPKSILVQHTAALRKGLARKGKGLSDLHGCPRYAGLVVEGRSIDITPESWARADSCQINVPFTLSVDLSVREARGLFQKTLYRSGVDAEVIYETRAPFKVASFELKFSKQKIFRQIEAQLSVNTAHVQAEAEAKVRRIAEKEVLEANIRGSMEDLQAPIALLTQQVMDAFFEEYVPTPQNGLPSCGKKTLCVRASYIDSRQTHDFYIKWTRSSLEEGGENYRTTSRLKPLADSAVAIGNATGRGGLKNKGETFETGLTVESGDVLEISPYYVKVENRAQVVSKRARSVHEKCYLRSSNQEVPCNLGIPVTRKVTQTDKWRYSLGRATFVELDQPMGRVQTLLGGLYLKFTWFENGNLRDVSCPLSQFVQEGDGRSVLVKLENQDDCRPFDKRMKNKPFVHLENRISLPFDYKEGFLVKKSGQGTVREPLIKQYDPSVEFAGMLSIRGDIFDEAY